MAERSKNQVEGKRGFDSRSVASLLRASLRMTSENGSLIITNNSASLMMISENGIAGEGK
jgi:hypothetical protein